MTTAAPIWGIKLLSYPPKVGEHWLSVNLALVRNVTDLFVVAQRLGFKLELVQISNRFGTEIHSLLFYEQVSGEPIATIELYPKINQLEEVVDNIELYPKINQLEEVVDNAAIKHTYGGRLIA